MEVLVGRVLRRSGGGWSGDGVVGGREECRVGEGGYVDNVSGGGIVVGKRDESDVVSASVGDVVLISSGARFEGDSMGEVKSNVIGGVVVFDGDGAAEVLQFWNGK